MQIVVGQYICSQLNMFFFSLKYRIVLNLKLQSVSSVARAFKIFMGHGT